MRLFVLSLSLSMLLSVVSGTALANEPAASAASAQTSSASTKATAPSAQAAKVEELTAAEKDLLAQGYKLRIIGGQKRFCRRQTVIGSNLERMVCTTGAQAAEARQNARDLTEQIQRNQANPSGH